MREPMTDIEFFEISVLFERKEFTLSQIQAFLMWVDHYTDNDSWASPGELISHMNNTLPNKQSGM